VTAGTDRGQAYTIEGIIGAILIASALVLGLQTVDIAPWTDSSTDPQTESLRLQTQDLLEAAEDRDALRTAATCIDGDGNDTPHPAVAAGTANNDTERAALGVLLNRTLDANNYRFSVYISYPNGTTAANGSASNSINTTAVTDDRDPTRRSVTATRQVALFDSDPILEFDPDAGECVPATAGVNNTLATRWDDPDQDVYVENQNENSDLYAVVRIRVVAW